MPRDVGRRLKLAGHPAGVDAPLGGGVRFFAYCLGAGTRARVRRDAVNRAWAWHRRATERGDISSPTALVLAQRCGVALEDLARLMLAFESLADRDPFDVLRQARIDELDNAYKRLAADPEALRRAMRLPTPEDTVGLGDELRDALLEASDRMASRWHAHWAACASGWLLLRHIAKAMRHGLPLIPRELLVDPPGAGALGDNVADRFPAWVLIVRTDVDRGADHLETSTIPADVGPATLAAARQAALGAVALSRELAGSHVHRVRTGSRWVLPAEAVRLVDSRTARVLRNGARG